MTTYKKTILFLLIGILFPIGIQGKVKLPSIIGDGMVLQRNTVVNIWGWAEPEKKIKVSNSWSRDVVSVKADKNGHWTATISTGDAGGPYTITIDDGEPRILEDVLLGEVWLCSGQSNMEMPMQGFESQPVHGSFETLLHAGEFPQIRLFHVPRATSDVPLEDCNASWEQSSTSSAATFSATGYYFATSLHRSLGIPVGMIESDWGATRIETWMSKDAALNVDREILLTNAHHDASNQVASLFNAMIMPLTNYTLKGFLWYQGESNKGYHSKYHLNMAEMVKCWRTIWGGGDDMPFYYVQLAPFDYDIKVHQFNGEKNPILLPLVVESQIKALNLIPNSGIAVNTDLGDALEIHPPRKDLVGKRLAMLALSKTYGFHHDDATGPLFKEAEFAGNEVIITFDSGSTLIPIRDPLYGFEIAGEDKVFHPAEAYVIYENYTSSKKVRVYSDKVLKPVAVRYAFRNVVEKVNLTNTLGLPAFPFRTDNWDNVYAPSK